MATGVGPVIYVDDRLGVVVQDAVQRTHGRPVQTVFYDENNIF